MQTLQELLQAARDGDRTARNDLIARFYQRVSTLVRRQMQQRLRPQQHKLLRSLSTGDIVQDVFLAVMRGLDRWEGDREEAFVALLATLVEHRLIDQVRHAQAARRDVRRVGDAGPMTAGVLDQRRSPATLAGNEEQLEIYREVLHQFEERDRLLLTMRLEDGVEFAELAERLAWPSADAARKAFNLVQAKLLLRLRQRGLDLDRGQQED